MKIINQMKIKQIILSAIAIATMVACTTDNFNYAPNVDILYNPLRMNDSVSIILKKVGPNNIKIDSMKIGDSLMVKVQLSDLVYKLKSVSLVADTDTSTVIKLPTSSDFKSKYSGNSQFENGNLTYKKSTKSDNIEFLYIAKKSSRTGHITIFLETENPDSINYRDSLRISTPVKFL